MALPDLKPRLAPAGSSRIGNEVANALSRLQIERPKLADACEPAMIARLVSLVLNAIDQECRWHFGLWTFDERRNHLRVWAVLRPDGVDIGMRSTYGGVGGYQREPKPWEERTKRKEELLRLPWVMEMVERVVAHAYALLDERHMHVSELVPGGKIIKGAGYARIKFFASAEEVPELSQ